MIIEETNTTKTKTKNVAAAQAALKSAEERREAALKVEASARTEVASHQRTAQEAREKYEMELRLHSQVRGFSSKTFHLAFTRP